MKQRTGNWIALPGAVLACLPLASGDVVAASLAGPANGAAHPGWLTGIGGIVAVLLLLTMFWLWRRNAHQSREILKAKKRLQYALEGSSLALWDYDIASGELYFSEQMALNLGRGKQSFIITRTEYVSLIHPEDICRVNSSLNAVINAEAPSFIAVYRVRTQDGSWKWLRSYGKVVERNKNGEALRLTGTISDTTAQQRMQEELLISERRWRFALEGSGDGVWDWHVASNDMFISERWKEMLGYGVDELENRFEEWQERVHPDDLECCYLVLNRHFNGETREYEQEQRMRCKDGSYKWILSRGKVVEWDNEGKPVRLIGTHTDISERRRLQEILKLQARAMEASIDGILIADASQPDLPIVYCNSAFEKLTGYSKEEILGSNCRFLQGMDCVQDELVKLKSALKDERAVTVRLRNYHKDGSLFWNKLSIAPVRGDDGRLTHYIAIANDVTEQIKAREALRRENEFSTAAINAMPGAFFVISRDNRILHLNDKVAEITGYSPAELERMNPLDFYIEEDQFLIADKIVEAFRDGESSCEARLLTKSGKILPFFLQSERHVLDSQECIVGTGIDISYLKQVQQALIKSQTTLNAMVEHMPAMVFLKRADDLSYVLINKVGEEILGYSSNDVLGKTDDDLLSPELARNTQAVDREVLANGQAQILPERQFLSRSGMRRYLYTIKTALYDEFGQVTHLMGISIDISDRKRAELRLKKSEELLQEAQRIAKIGNWWLNSEDHKLYWSDELFWILGLDPEVDEPSYEKFFSMLHPDDVESVRESEQRSFAQGTPHSLDVRIIRPDGEVRWVQIEALSGRDEKGPGQRLAGTFQDITERKLAERAIKQSEERLRTILNTAVDGIIIIDTKGKIESLNPAADGIFGYGEGELRGENIKKLMPEPYQSAHDGYLQRYQETKERRIIGIGREVIGLRKDGSTFPMDLAVSEFEVDGKFMYTGFVSDISLRKEFEGELLLAKEQAENASRAKSEFLSNMSHELRTPMNAILGFAQLLQIAEPPLSQTQLEEVNEIVTAGEHLLELINQLLDLARIEAGRLQISIEPIELRSIMDECMQMLEPLLTKHNVTMILPDADKKTIKMMADRFRLRQVMLNLLSNAVKYNKPGGRVAINCAQHETGFVRIEVEDSGIGIAPERLGEVFHSFSRLGAEATAIEGTGIGLAITQQLVELMQGKIGVTSQAGEGSIFWVELPGVLTLGEMAALETRDEDMPAINAVSEEAACTILYIEDNPANMRFMRQLLGRYPGYKLVTASESLEGISLAQSVHPDLILLDINLPDLDGYEVLRRLQASEATSDIPVVAVSANAMPDDIERAKQAGFRHYCTKPIDIEKFMSILEAILPKDISMS